jgi:hypothetical protein
MKPVCNRMKPVCNRMKPFTLLLWRPPTAVPERLVKARRKQATRAAFRMVLPQNTLMITSLIITVIWENQMLAAFSSATFQRIAGRANQSTTDHQKSPPNLLVSTPTTLTRKTTELCQSTAVLLIQLGTDEAREALGGERKPTR